MTATAPTTSRSTARRSSPASTRPQTGDRWRLQLLGGPQPVVLDRAMLAAMPQHTVDLPLACVEGWSTVQTWSGVRLADLARRRRSPAPGLGHRLVAGAVRCVQPCPAAAQPSAQSRCAAGLSGQRRRPVAGSRLSGPDHRARAPRRALHEMGCLHRIPGGVMSDLSRLFKRLYGERLPPPDRPSRSTRPRGVHGLGARDRPAVQSQGVVAIDRRVVRGRRDRPRPHPLSALRTRRPAPAQAPPRRYRPIANPAATAFRRSTTCECPPSPSACCSCCSSRASSSKVPPPIPRHRPDPTTLSRPLAHHHSRHIQPQRGELRHQVHRHVRTAAKSPRHQQTSRRWSSRCPGPATRSRQSAVDGRPHPRSGASMKSLATKQASPTFGGRPRSVSVRLTDHHSPSRPGVARTTMTPARRGRRRPRGAMKAVGAWGCSRPLPGLRVFCKPAGATSPPESRHGSGSPPSRHIGQLRPPTPR